MIDCCRLRAPLFALYFTFLQRPKHLSQNQHASDDRVIKQQRKPKENQVQGGTGAECTLFRGGFWCFRTGMQLASGRGIEKGRGGRQG